MGVFNRRVGIASKEAKIVKEAWQREPQHNMWGVINGYTLAAQSRELSVEIAHRMQQVGGLALNLVKR
jgi:hypothetical protein